MIIGLSGYASSGKDEVAKILVEEYGFIRVAFADKIRELLYEMNPPIPVGYGLEAHVEFLQDYVNLYGWDKGKQNPIIRKMLQNLGVGGRTVFGANHWIVEAVKPLSPASNNYVITDVRFKNEATWIQDLYSAQIWRVERPGVEAVNDHVSEHELDNYKFDNVLKNEGTLDDLRTIVRQTVGALSVN